MKKIKLSSEACCAICFTIIQFVCVVIACAFIFQACGSTCDIIGCVGYFTLASLVEVAKYKVVHIYYKDKVLEENAE
jgi:hypothetical protein